MFKSDDCLKNAHGTCQGFMQETLETKSTITRVCSCQCHDPVYQLIRNSVALVNQSSRNNPSQFDAADDA